jgi:hypothetical protein
MRPAGLEPATSWFEATRSIQLRYGRDNSIIRMVEACVKCCKIRA